MAKEKFDRSKPHVNIGTIGHVDHGKTTLTAAITKRLAEKGQAKFEDYADIDKAPEERERGITILAKTTAINYKNYRINILDTPGHADFGGEVERIMHMVDGVLLVVDAYEGTMPQTRFVLKKALEAGVKPIVAINKVDKPSTRIDEVLDEVLELFIELGADDEQLEFPVVYVSALNGTSSLEKDLSTQKHTMDPVLDMIVKYVPSPEQDVSSPLQFQPALLDYNDYVGRIGIGRIARGTIRENENVSCVRLDGTIKQFRIQKLFGFLGLKRIEVKEAHAGEIVAIAGLPDISVGETVCTVGKEEALEPLRIDEPTLQMTFSVNNSPFAGREGKFVTARKLEERLIKETQRDVSLKVRQNDTESWIVSGRGELHLSILIENMRRQGYEMQVSKPEVIVKEIDGVLCEPYEDLQLEVPEENVGSVIEALGTRGAEMIQMTNHQNQVRLNYSIPSRGLIGFMTDYMTMTKGYGIINHTFNSYKPMADAVVGERKLGVLVSMENGKASAYGLGQLEDRGVMFIEPGCEVYEGMIVGENNRENDLAVNVVKQKQQTNTRSAGKDHTVVLKRPRKLSLEVCLDYINSDELVEVTPKSIRLRKKILDSKERERANRNK